jgi:ribosomal protein S18 acetylase RimI-like enzyme
VTYRRATREDVEAIAALHAESWRRNYRGAFSDAFLDGDVLAERLVVWTDRLTQPQPADRTIVVEHAGAVVGFAHTVLDDDPTWGALLDNLHVEHHLRGQGIGSRLMAKVAAAVIEQGTSAQLYLWVLEQNHSARAFYEARGGKCVGREAFEPPGGGTATGLRYVWPDLSALVAPE